MLGDNPIFTLTVFVCPHDYATLVIMFYSSCFNKVPSRTFGKTWVMFMWSCCKKQKLCPHEFSCHFLQKSTFKLILFAIDWYKNCLGLPNLVGILEFHKYMFDTDYYRLFCFWQILFSMCCLLILMNLWLVLSGMNHREVRIQ